MGKAVEKKYEKEILMKLAPFILDLFIELFFPGWKYLYLELPICSVCEPENLRLTPEYVGKKYSVFTGAGREFLQELPLASPELQAKVDEH